MVTQVPPNYKLCWLKDIIWNLELKTPTVHLFLETLQKESFSKKTYYYNTMSNYIDMDYLFYIQNTLNLSNFKISKFWAVWKSLLKMAQSPFENFSELAPIGGVYWNLPHKFHLYLFLSATFVFQKKGCTRR